jgi:hypothetical protein
MIDALSIGMNVVTGGMIARTMKALVVAVRA